jgi:methyltransferase, FkbM family
MNPRVMTASSRARLFGLIDRSARRLGVRITLAVNTLEQKRLEAIRSLGINVVVDVGANVGQYARELRAGGYRGRIISFEPVPDAYCTLAAMASENHTCLEMGLGSFDGEAMMFITRKSVNSSFREPDPQLQTKVASAEVCAKHLVKVRKLDTILPSLINPGDRVYLKIDTQGFEKEVLMGAASSLSNVYAVEVELSLVRMYLGQALLPDVWNLLETAGFRPSWVERGFRDPVTNWLCQLDALFVRTDEGKPAGSKQGAVLAGEETLS